MLFQNHWACVPRTAFYCEEFGPHITHLPKRLFQVVLTNWRVLHIRIVKERAIRARGMWLSHMDPILKLLTTIVVRILQKLDGRDRGLLV